MDAVLLVIATTGCQPPPPAAPAHAPDTGSASALSVEREGTSTPPPGRPSLPDAGTTSAETAPPDATTSTVITPPPPPPQSEAQRDPHAFCAAYKRASVLSRRDRKKPRKIVGSELIGDDTAEGGQWIAARSEVRCTFVHEQAPGPVSLLHTPTCCPTGRGDDPCPPSSEIIVNGRHQLVEYVSLRPDGSTVSRSVSWSGSVVTPMPRHNCGRRPDGLSLVGESGDASEPGASLAAMAELEAASIPAFERLARELAHHGAPEELVRRTWLAMGDEVRHARLMTELAERASCTPRAVEVVPLPCRSLEEIARENVIEGCVREAYGALVATYQAERAVPALRALFAAIATDERRHAALSEDVQAWLASRLDERTRAELVAARAWAEAELRSTLDAQPACATLGLPGPADGHALFGAYFA